MNVVPPRPGPPPRAPVASATRGQRLGLVAGVAAVLLVALHLFGAILLPFVLAGCIAYFLDPAATRLTWIGIPRGTAALLLITTLLALTLLFVVLLYPLILAQIGLLISRIPSYITMLNDVIRDALVRLQGRFGEEFVDDRLRALAASQVSAIFSFLATALAQVVSGGVALFNVLTLLVVTPVVAFYLLRDWPRMVLRVDAWLPRRYAGVIREQGREIDRILSAWLRGQALCCLILAIYYSVALSAAGLELGLIVGVSAGLISFIPYVGTITGGLVSVGMAAAQFQDWNGVILVAVVFLAGNLIEGYVIYPRLLGDRVELHAVIVIFALFAGGAAFGFVGVLLAVPVAAAIGVVARYWLRRYLASPLYLDPPPGGS